MGWEIDIFWLTVLMFGSLMILLMLGLPLALLPVAWPACSCSCSAMRAC